jgi:hypothetical protein
VRISDWRDLRKPAPLLAILVLLLLAVALGLRLWDQYVEDGLRRWAVEELARATGGTYRLALSNLSFRPLSGSIAFDSVAVATDSTRNRRRSSPLPLLQARAQECRVSGLDLVRLLLRRSLHARVLECRRMAARIALVERSRSDGGATTDTAGVVGSVGRLVRPLGLSAVGIARVSFPSLRLRLERPGGRRGGALVLLEHARFEAEGIEYDPETASAERAWLDASGLLLRPDSLIEISADRLKASFTDSTLSLRAVRHEPAIPEAEWRRRVRVRRDRIRFDLDSLEGRGVAYRAFLTDGSIDVRALELRGARLDILTDRRIPRGPSRRRRTPQQVAAQTRSAVRLDSVMVRGGAIVYRERKPETERAGAVSFEQLRGTILDLDLPSQGEPLRIEASARLMGEGLLSARATVPLDAPDFRYEVSGRLGRMPTEAFNRFLAVNEGFQFDDGVVEEITFRQTVRGGRGVTAVTPRYRELSIEPTGDGGGVIGAVTRGVRDFIAGAFVVRSRNPDDEGEDLRTGRTVRRYSPERTWLQFLWFGLRDGLTAVLRE